MASVQPYDLRRVINLDVYSCEMFDTSIAIEHVIKNILSRVALQSSFFCLFRQRLISLLFDTHKFGVQQTREEEKCDDER